MNVDDAIALQHVDAVPEPQPGIPMFGDGFTERLAIKLNQLFQIECSRVEHGAKLRGSAALPRDRESVLKEGGGRAPISLTGKIFGS